MNTFTDSHPRKQYCVIIVILLNRICILTTACMHEGVHNACMTTMTYIYNFMYMNCQLFNHSWMKNIYIQAVSFITIDTYYSLYTNCLPLYQKFIPYSYNYGYLSLWSHHPAFTALLASQRSCSKSQSRVALVHAINRYR